jgi:hypothetical protein
MKKKQSKFNCDLNGSIMVMSALRYALGRHTYVPGAVQDWISDNWDSLNSNTKVVIVRDVFEHMYDENKPSSYRNSMTDYDLSTWEKFGIDKYWNLTSDKDRARWFAERLYGTQPV